MTKGTILYVGNYELPDKNAAAHRVMANGKIFRELGYNTVFLGIVRDSEHFDGIRVSSYDENIFEEAYPDSSKQWLRHLVNTDNIKSVISQYDDVRMVILYNTPYITVKKVRKALKNTDIKLCYDCTEWNSYAEGNFLKRYYKKLDAYQISHFLAGAVDGLIVISKLMEKQYSKNENMLRLPPLVDISDSIWNQTPIEHEGFEFLFAGTVSNKENLEDIISAVNSLEDDNVYFRVVGMTREEFLNVYDDCLINDDRVVFTGKLTHEKTVQYVLSCDAYVFVREKTLRNQAGFPTKFAEAYTCGVPIITTDVSDVRDYMDSAQCGKVIDKCDVIMIKEAMKNTADKGKTGYKNLRNEFDYHMYTDAADRWLDKVIK